MAELKVLQTIKNVKGFDFTGLQPFVFAPEKTVKEFTDPTEDGEILANPFPLWSIEIDGVSITSSPDDEEHSVNIECIVVQEIAPDRYRLIMQERVNGIEIYVIIEDNENFIVQRQGTVKKHKNTIEGIYNQYLGLVKVHIDKIYARDLGRFNASGKAKFKSKDGRKQTYKPNDVIYVGSQSKHTSRSLGGTKVRWSQGWSVRAHWRKLKNPEALGLDRQGNRVVKGLTWIGSHLKGDSVISPKVRKVR